MIINVLKAAGAEAISINDQRIVNMSEIRGVGNTGENIIINGKRVGLPYTIKAIGNSDYLESALTVKGGYVDELRAGSIEVEISKERNITIEKYDGNIELKYID